MGRTWRKKAIVASLAAAAIVVAWRTGLLDLAREPARLQAALRDLGPLGMLAYVGVFGLTQPLGMPGIALTLAASLVWSPPVAIALAITGFVVSSSVSFGFARSMGRDWVAARLPPRFRAWDERIARRGLVTVAILRVLFFGSQLVHLLLGISQVRFGTYLLGSALGYLPGVVFIVLFGPAALEWIAQQAFSPWWVAGGVALLLVGLRLARVVLGRRAARAGVAPPGTS
jgi:uncharacterized membrane protein YdjX (TVP38/TMEM64 family)